MSLPRVDRQPPTFVLSRWVFLRLLGAIYLIAFVSLAVPMTGLVSRSSRS